MTVPRIVSHSIHHRLSFKYPSVFRISRFTRHAATKGEVLLHSTIRERLDAISSTLSDIDGQGNWKVMQEEINELEGKLQKESVWDDQSAALSLSTRLGDLRKRLTTYKELVALTSDMHELAGTSKQPEQALARESADTQMQGDLVPELDGLHRRASAYLVSLWLSKPTDTHSAYIDIRAGSGGTEACDWASMLTRMYTKWAHSQYYTVEIIDESLGDVAGIKSTTLLITGLYAYGYAQYETGVHRLVRVSPFDAAGARHTSFASVRVSPHFGDDSQGAGGQHVNKTESAVRIVHLPSGVTVTCQQERSQHRNRATALSLLKSRLYDVEMQKRAQLKAKAHDTLPEIGWGSQIRSYVLHPYQLIKDVRTGHELHGGKP
ncbi:bacterial peptide chain release factor 2 (bRF-2) [Cristinia sonorae]|uniref:Bacterial peptide chain release factor 2 (BRF-2) n=1 Tax=Cristinia sonorae TaxID=1940300 RepID=A0A8K0UJW4_9AGAR|nr:bacterial peptide chain release factor 2 (bRF-2) [Cristinia sonorae]